MEKKYIKKFGMEQYNKLMDTAWEHYTQHMHREVRVDLNLAEAILICLGFQCFEKRNFAKEHEITVSWIELREFCRKNKKIFDKASVFDYIALFCSKYNFIYE